LRHLKPAAVLSAVTLAVVLLDAAVFVLPSARAEDRGGPSATGNAAVAAASGLERLALPGDPANVPDLIERALPTPTPTDSLAPTPSSTPSPSPTPTPTPTPKATPKPTPRDTVWNARAYVKARIGVRQYDCINVVWYHESKWNPRAGTPSSAYGIPQAFPGSRMAAFGSNWRYSPLTQVKWGIWYVNTRYGSACAAYDFWKAHAWY
jgi:hypothetical protein